MSLLQILNKQKQFNTTMNDGTEHRHHIGLP